MAEIMTKNEQESFKRFCDAIGKQIDTDEGKKVISKTANALRNGIIDKFHLLNDENIRQMLILHIATLPIQEALFGKTQKYNPITMILNQATNAILDIEEKE